jgi:hypothetical protein
MTNTFKVRYIGPQMLEIQKGKIYDAINLKDSEKWYGVKDDSGEWYAYAKEFFELVTADKGKKV